MKAPNREQSLCVCIKVLLPRACCTEHLGGPCVPLYARTRRDVPLYVPT